MKNGATFPSPFQGEGQGEGEKHHPRNLTLTHVARRLRRQLTPTEKILWDCLRGRQYEGLKFRRQYPLGRYVVDFICVEKHVIIEIDGSQHAENPNDVTRDAWLAAQGYRVLRFWNHDMKENLEGVLQTISSVINSHPHPNPLPGRERELPAATFPLQGEVRNENL